jgi:chromosome segregation ATPase
MFQRRVIEEHDEEESVFISMTDLSVSMLLLLVILLGFFASQYRQASVLEQEALNREQIAALQTELADLAERLANADPGGAIRAGLQQQLMAEREAAALLATERDRALADLTDLQDAAARERADATARAAMLARAVEQARVMAVDLRQELSDALAARDAAVQEFERAAASRAANIASLQMEFANLEARLAEADPGGAIRAGLQQQLSAERETSVRLLAERDRALAEITAVQDASATERADATARAAVLVRALEEARAAVEGARQELRAARVARDAAVQDFLREADLRAVQSQQADALRLELEAALASERDRVATLESLRAEAETRLADHLAASRNALAARDVALASERSRVEQLEISLRAASDEAKALRQRLEDQDDVHAASLAELHSLNAALVEAVERLTLEKTAAADGFVQRIAALEGNLSATMAQIVEVESVAKVGEAVDAAQAMAEAHAGRSAAVETSLPSQDQAHLVQSPQDSELVGRINELDAEIAMLRAQVSSLEGLLDALMNATTALLEKVHRPSNGERD